MIPAPGLNGQLAGWKAEVGCPIWEVGGALVICGAGVVLVVVEALFVPMRASEIVPRTSASTTMAATISPVSARPLMRRGCGTAWGIGGSAPGGISPGCGVGGT